MKFKYIKTLQLILSICIICSSFNANSAPSYKNRKTIAPPSKDKLKEINSRKREYQRKVRNNLNKINDQSSLAKGLRAKSKLNPSDKTLSLRAAEETKKAFSLNSLQSDRNDLSQDTDKIQKSVESERAEVDSTKLNKVSYDTVRERKPIPSPDTKKRNQVETKRTDYTNKVGANKSLFREIGANAKSLRKLAKDSNSPKDFERANKLTNIHNKLKKHLHNSANDPSIIPKSIQDELDSFNKDKN